MSQMALASAIKKVATGPHLSKDLSFDEAHAAMAEILAGDADPVQAAIFFIALRMKRETPVENWALLSAMCDAAPRVVADVDVLLDMTDPYNGYGRHCPVAAFLPPVLAACGLPTLSHGVWEMAPKFGITHAQVLSAAGVNITLSPQQAATQLADPAIGWAYLDQSQSNPALFKLQNLRQRMIKRPSLSTLEKLTQPIRARGQTHLHIGFVHKAYPPVLADLAGKMDYAGALIVRGLEGGIIPTLRETAACFTATSGVLTAFDAYPTAAGIAQSTRGVLPQADTISCEETIKVALAALNGQQGAAYDSLVYAGALALAYTGNQSLSLAEAAMQIREVLDNGTALAHLQGAKND